MPTYVFSDVLIGTLAGVNFVKPGPFDRTAEVASRIMVLLARGSVVLLRHDMRCNAFGYPIPAEDVVGLIPFDQVAIATGETVEEARKRLIVFAVCPEERRNGEPVIPLVRIARDLNMAEFWLQDLAHSLRLVMVATENAVDDQ